jgi:hypothetical protein
MPIDLLEKQQDANKIPKDLFAESGVASEGEIVPTAQSEPQKNTITNKIKEKVDPGAWEQFRSAFKPSEGIQSGVEDVVFQAGMGLAGKAAGGYAGAKEYLTGGSYEDAYRESERVSKNVSEYGKPQTETGNRYIENIGDLMETGMDLARVPMSALPAIVDYFTGKTFDEAKETMAQAQTKGVLQVLGDITQRETGSPMAGAVVEKGPGIAAELVADVSPLAIQRNAMNVAKASRIKAIESGNKELLAQEPKLAIPSDKELAGYRVGPKGKVEKDVFVKPLEKYGFDRSAMPTIRAADPVDKEKMLKMLSIKRQGMVNDKFRLRNRPSDVLGDSLLDRYKYISDVNQKAGKAVNKAAEALKGKQVNFETEINTFVKSMNDMGVKLKQEGGRIVPDFDMSDIEGLTGAEKAVSKVIKRMNSGQPGVMPDAYELHRLKKYIDNVVSYGKTSDGMVGNVERVLKQLRRDIDGVLDSNFENYNTANTIYSDTINAIDSLQDVAGKKIDLSGPSADKAVGTLLRRLSSNAQSRTTLLDAMDVTEEIAKKYGAKFADDIDSQAVFVNQLEKVFGSDADTSFMGQVTSAVADVEKSNLGKVKSVAKAAKDRVLGKDEEKAFDLLKEYLESEVSPWEE